MLFRSLVSFGLLLNDLSNLPHFFLDRSNVLISYTIALRKPQQRAVCRASRNSATSLNVDTSPGEELKTSLISGRSNRGMPLELRG